MPATRQRLYINVDHVATLRQARRAQEPDPVLAASLCERAGADGITAHLREDRRHIQDSDVQRLARTVQSVLNLEMAMTDEMLVIAVELKPFQVTLVPERREEITTEGGLDLSQAPNRVAAGLARLKRAGIRTSLFIDPRSDIVDRAHDLGADAIELHTGRYSNAPKDPRTIAELRDAAQHGSGKGLAVHAGHGLTTGNVAPVSAVPEIEELNIGHSIVSRSLFVGLAEAVREMRAAMDAARGSFR